MCSNCKLMEMKKWTSDTNFGGLKVNSQKDLSIIIFVLATIKYITMIWLCRFAISALDICGVGIIMNTSQYWVELMEKCWQQQNEDFELSSETTHSEAYFTSHLLPSLSHIQPSSI
ncbi:hypothetical protein Glove_14g35 [Diversispora epigaea]|uniref:Uncharacterized protein n=1 Tax=Diversispora epigaea TaxID=1348612 RepID=A0A397JNE2_9GLOM|nr:hypothetical protein Glove_14g35 [Diversispora epigaea]